MTQVQIIEARSKAGGERVIEFEVYSRCKDATIFGLMKFDYWAEAPPLGQRAIGELRMVRSNLGVPVREAFLSTLRFAERNGVRYVLVSDPNDLFPRERRAALDSARHTALPPGERSQADPKRGEIAKLP